MAISYLTLEDNTSYILLEDGGRIILDPGIPVITPWEQTLVIEADTRILPIEEDTRILPIEED